MIIGIDGNEANVAKRVGISEYAFELLTQFESLSSKEISFKIYLKNNPLSHMPKERKGFEYKVIGPRKMWTQFALPVNLYFEKILRPKDSPDIFFTPSHYAPRFSPIKTAISIMDLSYRLFPQLFNKHDLYQLTSWTKYSAKKASLIFTISQSSKNDIIKEYKVNPKNVLVTYPGIKQELGISKHKLSNMEEIKKKFGIQNPYILFVGTLQPRKNIEKLIESFALLKNKEIDLVIVGKKGWLFENILEAPKKFGVVERVKFLDFVNDDDLPGLYKNALCFVLPSLYEGFGLPVLEAMQYECPVITSKISSLPEAGGDAALYFDPEDVDDISSKIEKVISNETLRQEMIVKGKAQVKKFSWAQTATKTLQALKELGTEK